MTQEEKELLLKDLCGRLFYRIICKDQYGEYIDVNIYNAHIEHLVDQITSGVIKMVLRPMSSITEEENKEANENEAGIAELSSIKATKWCVSILNCGKIKNCYADNPIDACYEMIIRLNELNML